MTILNNIEYLTLKESALFLQVSLMTIHRWIKIKKLNPIRLSERKIYIKKQELENLLK